MKQPKIFYTDGGTSSNGKFGFQKSVICATDDNGKELFFRDIGDKTNNEAELLAILMLLQSVKNKRLIIYSDSQLAVNLINKKWFTDIERLNLILKDIWCIPKDVTIIWKKRDENKAGFVIEQVLGL